MKTLISHTLVLIFTCFSLMSCENEESFISHSKEQRSLSTSSSSAHMYHANDSIILGAQRSNPYEIGNMLAAWDLLSGIRGNFLYGNIEPYVNTIYYRVLPTDTSDLAILSADTSVIYVDYPLDYDILRWGSYYHDPSVADTLYTWLYAVVPSGHPLPSIQNVEILQECYLPDERDLPEDLPDWQNGFAMLEYIAYRETGNIDMYDDEAVAMLEEIYTSSPSRNSQQSRHQPSRSWSSFWDFITGVYPEGDFKVTNTVTNTVEGVKNAKVFIHNFIKIYCGPIDSNGHYQSSLRFRTHSWYHVRFVNYHTETKLYGGWKFLLGPIHIHLGRHHRYGCDHTFQFGEFGWRFASVNNAVETYWDYCQEYDILFPYNVRVWISEENSSGVGATPLFHKRNSPLFYNIISLPLAFFLDIPDMALFLLEDDSLCQTPTVYETVFHEFAHASHYEQVGDTYWTNYILHIIMHMGYGDHEDGFYAGYCGIGEMWGYFAGHHFLYKYLGCDYPYLFLNNWGNPDESMYCHLQYHPRFVNRYTYWFQPGILAKIHSDANCSITDIYNALNADVYSLEGLRVSLEIQGISGEIIDDAYNLFDYWNL